MARSSRSALLALCALAAVPWVVQVTTPGDLTAVMSWGLLNTNPWKALPFPSFLGETGGFDTLPWSLQVWPFGFAFYGGAVVSAASGVVFGREDVRVTAGLLALTAVDSVVVWWGLLGRGTRGAIPVGVVVIALVLWWFYWPVFSEFTGSNRREQ